MKTRTRVTLSLLALLAASGCSADPLQLSLWNPIQIVDEAEDVHGLRLGLLYARNEDVVGLDLGLGMSDCENMTGIQVAGLAGVAGDIADDVAGIQIGGLFAGSGDVTGVRIGGLLAVGHDTIGAQIGGLLNANFGEMTGIQTGGLIDMNFSDMTGVQLGGLLSGAIDVTGVQLGGLLAAGGDVTGVQLGGLLARADDMVGVQISGVATVSDDDATGLQIALMNRAKSLSGVQIGLINIVKDQWVPFVPFVNFSFGGFDDAEQQPAKRERVPKASYESSGLAITQNSVRMNKAPDGTTNVRFGLGLNMRASRSWKAFGIDLVKVGERRREARKVPDVKRGSIERPACTVFTYEAVLSGEKVNRKPRMRNASFADNCSISLGEARGYTEVEIRFGTNTVGFHVTP